MSTEGSLRKLAERLGIDPDNPPEIPIAEGEPYMPHSGLSRHWPRFASDCAGTMRIEERHARTWDLCCDRCRFELSIPAENDDGQGWLLRQATLPPLFASKPFVPSPESEDCRNAVRAWVKEDCLVPAPAIYGKVGRGKSHLLTLAVRELVMRRGIRARFVNGVQWLGQLQESIGTSSHRQIWDRVASAEVLAFDDLGAEMGTEWRADRIAALVDERYRLARPLAVTTNIRPGLWDEAFDARTASRLRALTFQVELRGVDRRSKQTEGAASA